MDIKLSEEQIQLRDTARKYMEDECTADFIREIEKSKLTRLELAEKAGVDQAVIWRFLNGERDIRLETADRLCEVLGLELRRRSRR